MKLIKAAELTWQRCDCCGKKKSKHILYFNEVDTVMMCDDCLVKLRSVVTK